MSKRVAVGALPLAATIGSRAAVLPVAVARPATIERTAVRGAAPHGMVLLTLAR